MLRLSNMSVRLGATTKTWNLNKYRDNGDTSKPGRSREPTHPVVKEEPTDAVVKQEHTRSRRHVMDLKHRHSTTPSRPKVKEEPQTSHVREEGRRASPPPQTEANQKVRSWSSLWSILAWIAIIGAMAWFASRPTAAVSDPQPHPPWRSVLQSRDLAVAKSRVNTVGRALNRPPSGLTLDDADGEVSFNHLRSAVLGLASKISRASQQVDLLGSFLGRELYPSIKTNVHNGNCSRFVSTRPIAQTARVYFQNTSDSLKEILSAHDHAMDKLYAYRSDIQQAVDSANEKARKWSALLGQGDDQEVGEDRRRLFEERTKWWKMLDDVIEELLIVREISSRKMDRYSDSSAGLDVLVEMLDEMAGREGLTRLHCGVLEAEGIERQFKEVVAMAAGEDEGRSFEEYYNAL